ncbi:GntR family transcriptional regulator [Pararhizobium mangrovi]|uniref:GntR family transcriptional regulator n=1 Tax=Pararhizobium mangrovi TaxID=2590452 RepID=UPI001F37DCD7|nr:GntR family transcriptional regulator [Pararhizobium mangrovi]
MDQPTPLYEQVRRQLLAEIEAGTLPEGSFLPPEPELCRRFDVSRITLRRAVSELCAVNVLIRQQGRGTMVGRRRVRQALVSLSGFSETMQELGLESRHRVLSRKDVDSPEIAMRLSAAKLVRVQRLFEVDDRPMTHEFLYFDLARFAAVLPDLEAGGSFYAALERHFGVVPGGAERTIDVVFPEADIRKHLDVQGFQPCYRTEKLVTKGGGEPLAFSVLLTPCHCVTYTLKV